MPTEPVTEPKAPRLTTTREPVGRSAKATSGTTSNILNMSLVIVIGATVAVFMLGYSVRRYHV